MLFIRCAWVWIISDLKSYFLSFPNSSGQPHSISPSFIWLPCKRKFTSNLRKLKTSKMIMQMYAGIYMFASQFHSMHSNKYIRLGICWEFCIQYFITSFSFSFISFPQYCIYSLDICIDAKHNYLMVDTLSQNFGSINKSC